MKTIEFLENFKPKHTFFVGVDSDGCVFDSMVIKQRECFGPWMIEYFGLQPVAKAAWQCKEFADLFSKTRGANRHKTVARILAELLPSHPMVIEQGFDVPAFKYYCDWVNDPNSLLSDAGLKKAIEEISHPQAKKELSIALEWSRRVDQAVADITSDVSPFQYACESMEKISKIADIVVISVAPCEALERDWQKHDFAKYVSAIAGQEMGSKEQHLEIIAKGRYASNHALMIGDAPGDLKAARKNGRLFYPINPGDEIKSWKRLYEKAFDKFINGVYAGDYEAQLIFEFDRCLLDVPPWKK